MTDLQDYVELVLDKITEVSGANCFKISDRVELKKGDSGYDLESFWSTYLEKAVHRSMKETGTDRLKYLLHARETSRCLQELKVSGVNKRMLFDDWILSIRREVMPLE